MITLDQIREAFPPLAVVPLDPKQKGAFRKLLTAAIMTASGTDNIPYARKMARVILSVLENEPYSCLPSSLSAHRATVDQFLMFAPVAKVPLYLRCIARATAKDPKPASFRWSLIAQSNQLSLPVPDTLRTTRDDRFIRVIRVMCLDPFYQDLLARAEALGFVKRNKKPNISGYIRHLIEKDVEGSGDV